MYASSNSYLRSDSGSDDEHFTEQQETTETQLLRVPSSPTRSFYPLARRTISGQMKQTFLRDSQFHARAEGAATMVLNVLQEHIDKRISVAERSYDPSKDTLDILFNFPSGMNILEAVGTINDISVLRAFRCEMTGRARELKITLNGVDEHWAELTGKRSKRKGRSVYLLCFWSLVLVVCVILFFVLLYIRYDRREQMILESKLKGLSELEQENKEEQDLFFQNLFSGSSGRSTRDDGEHILSGIRTPDYQD